MFSFLWNCQVEAILEYWLYETKVKGNQTKMFIWHLCTDHDGMCSPIGFDDTNISALICLAGK